MPLLLALARAFINFFGITRPTPQHERRAAWFIGGLLFAIVLLAFVALLGFLRIRQG